MGASRRRIAAGIVLAVLVTTSGSSLARTPRSTASKKPPAPTFASCGQRAADSTVAALNRFIAKAKRFDTTDPTFPAISRFGKAATKLNVKRNAAHNAFIDCIAPLAAATTGRVLNSSASSATAARPLRDAGATGATSPCVTTFIGAVQGALSTFASNVRAIGVDTTYGGAIQTATVVIGDLQSRVAAALAELDECLRTALLQETPAGSSSEPCSQALRASADAAQSQADAAELQADASGAPEGTKALTKARVAVVFGSALNDASATFVACIKRATRGQGSRTAGSVPSLASNNVPAPQPCPPHCDPGLPPPPPPPPPGPTEKEKCDAVYADSRELAIDALEFGERALGTGLVTAEPVLGGYGYLFILAGLELLKQARADRTACYAKAFGVD